MASYSPSSSRWTYDVFLSFHGETRRSFTDHLYTILCEVGVNTFRDDEEIKKGENISTELLKAIKGSRISVIIFSKYYARSKWCLDELVAILECKENMQQTVVPIFYDVDPSEVRNQTDEFDNAFIQHRERFGDQKVNEWKVALTKAANLSGWDFRTTTNRYESKFIEEITAEILRELNHTCMNVAKYPSGINSRAGKIIRLLESQKTIDDNVGMIGLYGMGGVGKPTLANAVYNLNAIHSSSSSQNLQRYTSSKWWHERKSSDRELIKLHLGEARYAKTRRVLPFAGGAPIITCDYCWVLLKLPPDLGLFKRKLRCNACLKVLNLQNRIQTVPKAITEQAPTLAPPPSEVGESSDLNERNLSAAP